MVAENSCSRLTRVFQYQLDVKNSNHFAFTLADIDVAVHGLNFANLGLDIAVLGLELEKFFFEPSLCPLGNILVNPMPVIGVVKNHVGG